jgi:hypothetical protein
MTVENPQRVEEMITALNSKVLDLEKDLAGLKGRDHSGLEKELVSLKEKVETLLKLREDMNAPKEKKEAIEKDELAEILGD